MSKEIYLREGFSFVYNQEQNKTNIIGLYYEGYLIAKDWMEIVDFIAILESGLRGKLGTKHEYRIGSEMVVYGIYTNEFLVTIKLHFLDELLTYDLVQTQQLTSKLNKLVHTANKLYQGKEIEVF